VQTDVSSEIDRFIWDSTEPIATRPLVFNDATAPTCYYMHDGNKNIIIVFDVCRSTITRWKYSAFGNHNEIVDNNMPGNPFLFSSEYIDTKLGQSYFNLRHYNPFSGRWQNADPVENYFSPNLYSMVNNDVMSRIDVLGLKIKVEKRDQEKLLPIFKELFGEVVFDGKGYLVIDKGNNSIGCKCVNLIKEEPTYTISIDDDETALYGGGAFSPLDFQCGGHIYIGSKKEYDQGNEIEFAFSWPPIRTKRNIKSQLDILAHELGHAMTHQAKMKDADRKLPHGDRNKKRLEEEAKKFETLIRNRCHEK